MPSDIVRYRNGLQIDGKEKTVGATAVTVLISRTQAKTQY